MGKKGDFGPITFFFPSAFFSLQGTGGGAEDALAHQVARGAEREDVQRLVGMGEKVEEALFQGSGPLGGLRPGGGPPFNYLQRR